MKRKVFTAMMLTFALSQVACEKKEDCLTDAGCLAKARAQMGPQFFPLTQSAAAGQVPGQPGQLPGAATFRMASVADAAIKAHSLKVQSAIKADDSNPESIYYKAPAQEIPPVDSLPSDAQNAGRGPANVTAAAMPTNSVEAAR